MIENQNTGLNKVSLSKSVKDAIISGLVSRGNQISYEQYAKYCHALKHTKFFFVCINQYGSSSKNFQEIPWDNTSKKTQYINKLMKIFERLQYDPYGFVYGKNIQANITSPQQKIQILQYTSQNGLSPQKQIDKIILSLIKQNLKQAYKNYSPEICKRYLSKMQQMTNKTANNVQQLPHRRQWEQCLSHALNINILGQFLDFLKTTHGYLKRYFQAINKPILSQFALQVSRIVNDYTYNFPNIDEQAKYNNEQYEREKKFQQKSLYGRQYQKTFNDLKYEEQEKKKTIFYRCREVRRQQELWQSKEAKYYEKRAQDLDEQKKQKIQNTSERF